LNGKKDKKKKYINFGHEEEFLHQDVWSCLPGFSGRSALFNSCKTTQPTLDYKDLSYLYNPTKSPINPLYYYKSIG
jgi:hypothetical protein